MTKVLVVLTTIKDRVQGVKLAKVLIREKLVACVNVLPRLQSVYLWKGKLEKTGEVLLIIKTTGRLWTRLQKRIEDIHPYEVPEIIALPTSRVSKKYLKWLLDSVV